jgi:hypothetical protein
MPSSLSENEFAEYYCQSGVAITCLVIGRTEQLTFVQFRTDWPGYRDFSNYARVALFPEHLRPADPQSPGFVQAIAREVVAQQQYLSDRRHRRTDNRNRNKRKARGSWLQRLVQKSRKVMGSTASQAGTCQRAESQGKRRGRSFFEARPANWGIHARGFPLRSVTSEQRGPEAI